MKGITDVFESTLKLLVPQSVEETYATVVNEAMRLVGATHGSIFTPENGLLKRVYTTNKRLYKVKPRKNGFTYKAFQDRVALLRSGKELSLDHKEFKDHPVGSDILIPLTYGHISIGTLSVMSAKSVIWEEENLNLLRTFGPIATLAIRNAHLNNELKHAVEMRDLFISMAAHELKTPITSIHLYAQVIEKAIKSDTVPKLSSVETLVSETQRLTRLVNELMDVAHIQQGRLRYDMKKTDIISIIQKTLKDFRREYKNYKFTYKNKSAKRDFWINGDPDKLRQVISNILNNSVKFSDEASTITIELSDNSKNCFIKIKDEGIGISEDEIPYIFDRYFRGSGKNTSRRGIGLGLALVKSIIEEHGGKIDVKSKKGKGTAITLKLPKYKMKKNES